MSTNIALVIVYITTILFLAFVIWRVTKNN